MSLEAKLEDGKEVLAPNVKPGRGRKKKSNFYHIRWNKVRINETVAAEVIGVTVAQILEWDIEGAPIYVERLLLLWDRKNIGAPGWDGWLFSRGALLYRGKRFTAELLLEKRDYVNRVYELESELYRLKTWRGLSTELINRLPAIRGLR